MWKSMKMTDFPCSLLLGQWVGKMSGWEIIFYLNEKCSGTLVEIYSTGSRPEEEKPKKKWKKEGLSSAAISIFWFHVTKGRKSVSRRNSESQSCCGWSFPAGWIIPRSQQKRLSCVLDTEWKSTSVSLTFTLSHFFPVHSVYTNRSVWRVGHQLWFVGVTFRFYLTLDSMSTLSS